MKIGTAPFEYNWLSDWATIPDPDDAESGWAHHGMAVTQAGEIIGVHPANPSILVFSQSGDLYRSFAVPIREGHQLALSTDNGEQYLWIADPGRKNLKSSGYDPVLGERGGQVLCVSLNGQVKRTISTPDHPVYEHGNFAPTSMTVFDTASGGN